MKISGTAALAAPPDRVFDALNDPAVLAATIPGVESLDQVAPDHYRMTVTAGVASIKGSYDGEVRLSDQQAPTSFTLAAKGSGAPGSVDAMVRVRLDAADGGTHLSYDAEAVVGGMIGGVGQRMLVGVSRKMAGQFFGAVDRVITDGVPAAPVPGELVPAAAAATTDAAAPVAAATAPAALPTAARTSADDPLQVPFWIVLAGVGAGAVWALVGVAVGWAVSRRRNG